LKSADQLTGAEAATMFDAALATVEAGSRAGDYHAVRLILPASKWVGAAWNYRPVYGMGDDSRCLGNLCFSLQDAAKIATENNQSERTIKIGVALELGLNASIPYLIISRLPT